MKIGKHIFRWPPLVMMVLILTSCGGGGGGGAPPPPPSTFVLQIVRNGDGGGTVTSSPPGINCGSTCSAIFSSGQTVFLTATPASGSAFAGWGGDSDCADGNVTMNANKTCTATFSLLGPPSFDIRIGEFDGGGGASAGGSFAVIGVAGQGSGAGLSSNGSFALEGGV